MKSQAVLFFAIIASFLYKSLAGPDDVSSTVCLLQDEPNQCGKFCLTALKPLIDHIALHQQQWNTRDAVMVNETQTKLNRIEGQLDALRTPWLNFFRRSCDETGDNEKQQHQLLRQTNLSEENWTGAITTCGQMGGQLASIENESEFDAIVAKLKSDISYRVDINDLAEKGSSSPDSGNQLYFSSGSEENQDTIPSLSAV
ncbi:uncharacterized protein LOC110187202 [Drosophila serrata]|uniref:uncharacterized protein LOC110187202 n=1 Tax=Drosophila serrata TaxID=7274 RepID=UPI000A1D201E|nr:uncharacterized protein LOC110187202 [Drosophila serrata]